LLRTAFREAHAARPFEVVAAVVLPDHLHCLWRLPPTAVRRVKTALRNRWNRTAVRRVKTRLKNLEIVGRVLTRRLRNRLATCRAFLFLSSGIRDESLIGLPGLGFFPHIGARMSDGFRTRPRSPLWHVSLSTHMGAGRHLFLHRQSAGA
jgi:hypothetical protein